MKKIDFLSSVKSEAREAFQMGEMYGNIKIEFSETFKTKTLEQMHKATIKAKELMDLDNDGDCAPAMLELSERYESLCKYMLQNVVYSETKEPIITDGELEEMSNEEVSILSHRIFQARNSHLKEKQIKK